MVLGSRSESLSHLEVLVIDCQATAAAPRGHLLEIGWAQVRNTVTHPHACLVALPDGEQIPPAVSRITGISEHMMWSAVDKRHAWSELSDQVASLTQQPVPRVIHFAQFEQPFLRTLAAAVFPLDVVCTRDIARRRAIWLTRLFDSSVMWRDTGDSRARLIVIENGVVASSAAVDASASTPIPPGYCRPVAARREAFALASLRRLRVLTPELKRLSGAGAPVALRLGVGPVLDQSRLASALWWV